MTTLRFWMMAVFAVTPLLPAVGQQTPAPTHGLDLSAMDTTLEPCDNFYQYANGHWLATAVIGGDYSSAGTAVEVNDRNLDTLHTLADRAAADTHAKPDSPAGKVGSFYRSGMDEASIEADGITPLASELARIDAVHDVPSLLTEIGHLHRMEVPAGFGFSVSPDLKDSSQEIAQLFQGGTQLPARGYYINKDAQDVRDAYVAHVTKMLTLSGQTPDVAAAGAKAILALETALAVASKDPAQLRDPQANYHAMTLADLDKMTPGVDWQPYFTSLHLMRSGTVNVAQPAFFTALGATLTSTPIGDWKTDLRWNLVHEEATRLPSAFVSENFQFYSTTLRGVPQMAPRWKRVLRSTDSALGEALGQLYVAQAFPPAAKARALALVQNLKAALRDDLTTLPWMTETTRREALTKLDAMQIKIGYPDKWRDYGKLDVSSPAYVVNAMRADEFDFQHGLDKIGKRVDHKEWHMSPPTVNAYYSPTTNDINFPAGILQPPFFDPQADDAVNYGAIGAVIGHEMTHGFDDKGRQFDAHGTLRDWWTEADAQAFTDRAQHIAAQYSAFEPLPGEHINGSLTLGENIADIGGLKIAYLALEKSLQGKPRTLIDGFTPRTALFPRLRPGVAGQAAPGEPQGLARHRPALAAPIPRPRRPGRHARIPPGLRLPPRPPGQVRSRSGSRSYFGERCRSICACRAVAVCSVSAMEFDLTAPSRL